MTTTHRFFATIVLIFLLIFGAPKQQNWWVDGQAMHRITADWQPDRHYSPDLEEALSILGRMEPDEVLYIRSRGYPVSFVPGSPDRKADTTASGVIEIPYKFQGHPAELAVLLSHEIVHEMHHDPFLKPSEYSVWRRLIWHQEEEVAHNTDLYVAMRLWPSNHSVWNVLGKEWLLEPFLYLLKGPLCLVDIICFVFMSYRPLRHFLKWLVYRLRQRGTRNDVFQN
jgi:hypothetical protein